MDNKEMEAKVQLNEAQIKAIVSILSKEGVITQEEVDEEVKNILEKNA